MYKNIIWLFIILWVGCKNRTDESFRFTQAQIDSLYLDSTKLMQVDAQTATRIDLNRFLQKQSFDFGAKVEEVRLIPLETNEESLVGNIYKLIVTDSMNYIYDNYQRGGLIIFDRNGKFIKRISPGRGPGELHRLYDIAYDWQNNELLAYQHPFLLFYTPQGEFIRQVRLPFGFYNFLVTSNGYIFKTLDKYGNEHLGNKMDYTLLATDKNFKLEYAGLPSSKEMTSIIGYSYLYSNDGKIWITQNDNDTIYRCINETKELRAEYIMDYHSKKLPDYYLNSKKHDRQNILNQNDYYYSLGEYLETTFHHVFFLRNDYIGFQTIIFRDKRTGNMIGGTDARFNNNEIPSIAFPKTAFGAYFVSVHYPDQNDHLLSNSSIITNEDKQKIKERKEDDNPILVFYRLKTI